MQRVEGSGTAKQTHRYYIGGSKERHIVISSNFDSGNLADVKQISQFSYRISSASDCIGTPYEGNTRSWFYFSATGFPPNTRGRFLVSRVNILWSFINSKMGLTYHPCYNNQPDIHAAWKKLQQPGSVYENVNGEVQLQFDYLFTYENEVVKFALTYPYEYSRCIQLTRELSQKFENDEDVLFEKEVIVKTPEERDVQLLTIGEKKQIGQPKERQQRLPGLFPNEDRERPMKQQLTKQEKKSQQF